MIADLQSERMDEQRAQLPGLVSRRSGGGDSSQQAPLNSSTNVSNLPSNNSLPAPDDAFLDMLIRCQVNHNFFSLTHHVAPLIDVKSNLNVEIF